MSSAWVVLASTAVEAFVARRFTAVIDCPPGPRPIQKGRDHRGGTDFVLREAVQIRVMTTSEAIS